MNHLEMMLIAWCLGIGLSDLYYRRIPNTLIMLAGLVATGYLLWNGHSILGSSVQSVALGVAVSMLLSLPAYATRLLGAGDVKLLITISLLGGCYCVLFAFMIAALLAMTVSFTHMMLYWTFAQPVQPGKWIPFGTALSAGLIITISIVKWTYR